MRSLRFEIILQAVRFTIGCPQQGQSITPSASWAKSVIDRFFLMTGKNEVNSVIGVWRRRQIFRGAAEFSQTCPKKLQKKATSKDKKKLFMTFWVPFLSNQSMLSANFAHFFRECFKIFRYFHQIKTFEEGVLAPPGACIPASHTSEFGHDVMMSENIK